MRQSETLTATANVSAMSLAGQYRDIHSILWQGDGAQALQYRPYRAQLRTESLPRAVGTPRAYFWNPAGVTGSTLTLAPSPAKAGTLTVEGYGLIATPTADSTASIGWPEQWITWLEYQAKANMLVEANGVNFGRGRYFQRLAHMEWARMVHDDDVREDHDIRFYSRYENHPHPHPDRPSYWEEYP